MSTQPGGATGGIASGGGGSGVAAPAAESKGVAKLIF
jgi:hypothetical protein